MDRQNLLTHGNNISSEINDLFFDLSPEAIFIVDTFGKIIRSNSRIKEWLGYEIDQIVGNDLVKLPFLTPRASKNISQAFHRRLRGHKVDPYEIECRSIKGEQFFGRVIANVIKNDSGRPLYDLMMISNITSEHQVRITQEEYTNDLGILSETAVGFVELSPNNDIYDYIGQQLLKLVGDCFVIINSYDSKKSTTRMKGIFGIDQKYEKLIFKLLKPNPLTTDFPLSENAKQNLVSKRLVRIKDGLYGVGQGKFPWLIAKLSEAASSISAAYTLGFSWHGQLFGNAVVLLRHNNRLRSKSIEAFLHQAAVAIQRHRTEQELRAAHAELEDRVRERTHDLEITARDLEKFKQAVDNASDAILIADQQANIIYTNSSASINTGYQQSELIGRSLLFWCDQLKSKITKPWQEIKAKKPLRGEVNNIRKDQTAYIAEFYISPILNGEEILFYVYIERDITRAKEIDQAKNEFVSLASHQLRTPLTSISWYTEAILNGDIGEINKEQQEYLHEVSSASQRMVKLVGALLNVSRIELGTFVIEPETTDLPGISKSVVAEMRPKIKEKEIEVVQKYQKIPKMKLDPNLTRIIFQNLISNAIKYTQSCGRVRVDIKVSRDRKLGRRVIIKVSDNGYGIPKRDQTKVFSKLFRSDNVREKISEGTGLGLYIVKSILDHSGGDIKFSSAENKGTSFIVSLPMSGMTKKVGSRELSLARY